MMCFITEANTDQGLLKICKRVVCNCIQRVGAGALRKGTTFPMVQSVSNFPGTFSTTLKLRGK